MSEYLVAIRSVELRTELVAGIKSNAHLTMLSIALT